MCVGGPFYYVSILTAVMNAYSPKLLESFLFWRDTQTVGIGLSLEDSLQIGEGMTMFSFIGRFIIQAILWKIGNDSVIEAGHKEGCRLARLHLSENED